MPANHIKLKLWINHKTKGGFSESYNMDTTDYAVATTRSKAILDYRSLLLPLDTVIEYHSMALVDAARDSEVVPSFLRAPAETLAETGNGVEACDMLDDGISVRFYTSDGKHTTFLYRALRDSWIANQLLTITPTSGLNIGTIPAAAAGLTDAQIISSFLVVVREYTVHVKKTAPGVYTLTAWNAYGINGIRSRDTGKGYSWSRGRRRAVR